MNRFPMSIDLQDKTVFLIGSGAQIRQKAEKLRPFGARLVYCDRFTPALAQQEPAMVIAGDLPREDAEGVYDLCCRYRIPVNVVDVPELCSFYFPALITRGDLTVSVSTAGRSPAAAACLRRQIEQLLPEETEAILLWLGDNREFLKEQKILKQAAALAFSRNRPLTQEELSALTHSGAISF